MKLSKKTKTIKNKRPIKYKRSKRYNGGSEALAVSNNESVPNEPVPNESVPFETLGFSHGASSASQQAMLIMKDRNEQQNAMNKMSGGKNKRNKSKRRSSKRSSSKRSGSKKSKLRISKSKRSGSKKSKRSGFKKSRRLSKKSKRSGSKKSKRRMNGGEITVPQFSQLGNIPQAYTSTELSKGGNYTTAVGASNAEFDCYATNSCPKA